MLTWVYKIVEFSFTQAIIQIIMGVCGLIVIRTLSKDQYALYAITNSMQSTANLLADLGIGIGMRSVGGRVWNDKVRFGQLVNTALSIRHKFTGVSLAVVIPLSVWTLKQNHATPWVTGALCAVIVLSAVPQMSKDILVVVPQLLGDYRWLQRLELGNAAFRLAALVTLAMTSISALSASVVGGIVSWSQLFFSRRFARAHIEQNVANSEEDYRVLLRVSLRSVPNIIFFCFQSQVTIFILSLEGNSHGLADITALGRLTVILTVLAVIFNNLLGPAFSKCQDPRGLSRLYTLLMVGAGVALAPTVAFAALFPSKMLWILGSNYESLQKECVWIVASGCLAQLAGVTWALNSTRAWIRFQSVAYIPSVVVVQAIAGYILDLRAFHNVVVFNFLTILTTLVIYVSDSISGLSATRKLILHERISSRLP